MYHKFLGFFGLPENPFNGNPDPRYLYFTPQTQAALKGMTNGIQARKGLILLTGEAGTGKTTLVNQVIEWLDQQRIPRVFIFNSHLDVNELFGLMLAGFGIPRASSPNVSALARLNQWLLGCYGRGVNAVLIVDEAQGLPSHVLEEIRMLLNQETSHEKLLQIVLSGQPELAESLRRPELRQIRQRISLHSQTKAFNIEQSREYIRERLRIAGAADTNIFETTAVDAIQFYAQGIPRVMNLLCEHALIRASAARLRPVPAHLVHEVACEFEFDDCKPAVFSINTHGDETGTAVFTAPIENPIPSLWLNGQDIPRFIDDSGTATCAGPANERSNDRGYVGEHTSQEVLQMCDPASGYSLKCVTETLVSNPLSSAHWRNRYGKEISPYRFANESLFFSSRSAFNDLMCGVGKRLRYAQSFLAVTLSYLSLVEWTPKWPRRLLAVLRPLVLRRDVEALLRWLQGPIYVAKVRRP